MAKMTIAQLREREVYRLAQYHSERPSDQDIETARKLMNSFYRLCGLSERNLYLANDERWCNRKSTKESEERESRWCKRLSAQFKDFAGLELFYAGYCPSIGIVYRPSGGCAEKITRWFYQ